MSTPQLASGPRASTLYLPSVHGGPNVAGTGEKDKARAIFARMQTHPEQGRKGMVWDDQLATIAQGKCKTMAHEGWVGHTDPQGHGPNWLVRACGYVLPDGYDKEADANNIESLGYGGTGTVIQMWDTFMRSSAHRTHILGLLAYFAQQTHVGIGYCGLESSEQKHYWCVLSVPPMVMREVEIK